MNKILGIQIPENLAELDNDALKALRSELRTAAQAAATGDVTLDVLAEVKQAREAREYLSAMLTERTEADKQLATERQAELDALAAEGDDDPEPDPETDPEPEPEVDPEVDPEPEGGKAVTASAYKPKAGALADPTKAPVVPPSPEVERYESYATAGFVSTNDSNTVPEGETFTDHGALGESLAERWKAIAGGDNAKHKVGILTGKFTEAQTLDLDPSANIEKLGGTDPLSPKARKSVTAALCAPTEPTYALATTSSTARPVKGSLAVYKPARGKVSVYPTPKLGDIDDEIGRGLWTATDDANPSAEKVACATIACANSETYTMYGLYRCMTIKNMLYMTFPELVEAYLNRLGALTARLGDSTLLDAMIGSVNTKEVSMASTNQGASINFLDSVLRAAAVFREEERYGDQQFDAWIPRWVIPAMQSDLLKQRRTSGTVRDRIPSVGELNAVLRDAGIDVTWTLDYAETWPTVPPVVDGQPLPDFPTDINFIMAPKGNFRALDRGDLSIGVANGNIYRDSASNKKNEFTIFQESFEGLMDLGATNYHFTLEDVCFNGAQTADVTAIACSGS